VDDGGAGVAGDNVRVAAVGQEGADRGSGLVAAVGDVEDLEGVRGSIAAEREGNAPETRRELLVGGPRDQEHAIDVGQIGHRDVAQAVAGHAEGATTGHGAVFTLGIIAAEDAAIRPLIFDCRRVRHGGL